MLYKQQVKQYKATDNNFPVNRNTPFQDQRSAANIQLQQKALLQECAQRKTPGWSGLTAQLKEKSEATLSAIQMKTYNKSVNLVPGQKGGYNNIDEITTAGTDPKSQSRDLRDTLSTLFNDNRDFTGAHMIPQRLGGSGDDTNCRPWPSAFENTWNTNFDNKASSAQSQIKNVDADSKQKKKKLNPLSFTYQVETDDATTGESYHLLLSRGFANAGTEKERAQLQIHASRLDAIPRAVKGHYKTVETGGKSVEYNFAKSDAPWTSLNLDQRSGLSQWWTSMQLKLGMIPQTAYDTLAPNLTIDRDISDEARGYLGTHVDENLGYRATGGKNRHIAKPPTK